jgi:ABC-type nitrate/sulfonate/bicarbonate transport system permease component
VSSLPPTGRTLDSPSDPEPMSAAHPVRVATRLRERVRRGPARNRRERTLRIVAPIVFSVLVIGVWELYCVASGVSAETLPKPQQVWDALVEQRSLLLDASWRTIQAVLIGFACAVVVGVALGAAIHASRVVEAAVYPWLVVTQMIPIPAVAPIFVIWFGFDIRPKVLVVALVAFFPVVVNTVDGLRAVDPEMVSLLRTLGASRRRIYRVARLPAALPFIFSGMKVAAAFSVIGAVFGEWVGTFVGEEGLGSLILQFNNQSATAEMFACIVVLAVVGIALFLLVGLAERLTLPWYHQARAEQR